MDTNETLEPPMFVPIGDEAELERTPVVNNTLIGVNALVFFFVNTMSSDAQVARLFQTYGLIPAKLEWYQFLTCMFLHADFMHIVGNLIFLFIFGDNVEDQLGHLPYLFFYVVSGIGASGIYVALTADSLVPCVGASGAIFGVVAGFAILQPHVRVRMLWWWWVRGGTFLISGWILVAFWILEQLAYYWFTSGFGGGIAYAAHLGGALFGGLIAVGFRIWGKPVAPKYGGGSEAFGLGVASTERTPPPSLGSSRPTLAPAGASSIVSVAPTFESTYGGDPPSRPGHDRGAASHADRASMSDSEAVLDALDSDEPDAAFAIYARHANRSSDALDPTAQAAVAAAFFARAEFSEALKAYRGYLHSHPTGPDSASAKFRAGVILSRRMKEKEEGAKLLLQAVMEHPDPEVVALARAELERTRSE